MRLLSALLLLLAFVVPATAQPDCCRGVAIIDNAATAGDLVVVAGKAGQSVRVYRIKLLCGGANTVTVKSGTTNTPPTLDPPQTFPGNSGMILDLSSLPWYVTRATSTASDNDFILNFTAATSCTGIAWYSQS